MSDLDRPTMTLEPPTARRSPSSRLADLGDRVAKTFAGAQRARREAADWDDPAPEPEDLGAPMPEWEGEPSRFRVTRRGYDCAEVDEYVADLEREIEDLRGHPIAVRAVDDEIDRLGEQTAAILRVAHEQAREITRSAEAQAHTCLTEAAAEATKMTESARRHLRQLDVETDSVWRERSRLLEDVRHVADALVALADDASERFPAEAPRIDQPVAAPHRAQPQPIEVEEPSPAQDDAAPPGS